jgi:hypothetical protein
MRSSVFKCAISGSIGAIAEPGTTQMGGGHLARMDRETCTTITLPARS